MYIYLNLLAHICTMIYEYLNIIIWLIIYICMIINYLIVRTFNRTVAIDIAWLSEM